MMCERMACIVSFDILFFVTGPRHIFVYNIPSATANTCVQFELGWLIYFLRK